MDQFRMFLRSLSKKDLDDLLEEVQHDRPENSEARAHDSAGDDSNNLHATIEGMQRQIEKLIRGLN